ncbi:alpha/beta fold hydrolase [Marinomonas transparens]|uniref:Alpha/beta hydrolase n=1 Tax=Marinomonas transparens TaxID=2795388 RepID=A0A934N146_9GAMM|nr:alpha/beta hydrolase [Marinomonas transparens]MBJ7537382.1 alpha/beta hydrolase [Marinomonas transparens]
MTKIVIFSGFTLLLTACAMPKEIKENEAIAQEVMQTPNLIHNEYVTVDQPQPSHRLHYVSNEAINNARPTVVFVHGTPGDWSSFARYFLEKKLIQDYQITSIDRPGWGKSGYAGNVFPTNLQTQSDEIGPMLKDIWQKNGHKKVILVGHSLGASLVPMLAADYPEYTRGVIILAGDLEPKLAEPRWYNTLLDWIPNAIIPDEWANSNLEVLDLSHSLEQAQNKLANLTLPVLILQGTKDELVNPESANYAKTLFKKNNLEVQWIQGASHIINLTHVANVKGAIRKMDELTK